MVQFVLDGDIANQYLDLAKNRISSMRITGASWLSSGIPVDGGLLLAQILGERDRAIIRTRRRNVAYFVKSKTVDNFELHACRYDGSIQPTASKIPAATWFYSYPWVQHSKYRNLLTYSHGDPVATVDDYYGESITTITHTVDAADFDTKDIKALITISVRVNVGTEPFLAFAPLGVTAGQVAHTAVLFVTMIGTTYYTFILSMPDTGNPTTDATGTETLWPFVGYERHNVHNLSCVGRGKLMFFVYESAPDPLLVPGWVTSPPQVISYDVFGATFVATDLVDIDDRFDYAAGPDASSDITYIGNGKAMAVIGILDAELTSHPSYPNVSRIRVFSIDVATNVWTLVPGDWEDYTLQSGMAGGVPMLGTHGVQSFAPGNCVFYTWFGTGGGYSETQWITEDYGVTWTSVTVVGSFSFWHMGFIPMQYNSTTGMPSQFGWAKIQDNKIYMGIYSDIGRTTLLRTQVIDSDVDYSWPSTLANWPLLNYLGDEDDRAPLLAGHKDVLETLV